MTFRESANPKIDGNLTLHNVSSLLVPAVSQLSGPLQFRYVQAGQRITLRDLRLLIHGEEAHLSGQLRQTSRGFEWLKSKLRLLNGTISSSGQVGRRFQGHFQFQKLAASRLWKVLGGGLPQLSGVIDTLDGSYSGIASSNVSEALQVSGSLSMQSGRIADFNLGKRVLDKLNKIPFIGGLLLMDLPEEFTPYLQGDDTTIEDLKAQIRYRGRRSAV